MFSLELLALIALFFIFIYVVYQSIRLLFRYLIIAFTSALFPIILVKFFDVNLPLNLSTILIFIYLGITGYTIYLSLSIIEKIGKGIIKIFRKKKKED